MSTLFSELGRRNVFRVAALYLVSAWLIAQVADVVIGLGNFPPAVGRVVLIVLALGFPVAVVLAWIFEWTPGGIRRETASDDTPPAAGIATGRQVDFVIIALLTVGLLYFAATHDWHSGPPIAQASIAVLPFENRGASSEDDYFTDGVHDDLLTQLAKIGSLVVISRNSVMQYRNSDKPLRQIAGELGVATVLTGGVRRAGDRVRINLQLIDGMSDRYLWAETFDRELTAENVFAIQSAIARSIADTLQAKLLPGEEQRIQTIPTRSMDAYDAYLFGRRKVATRDFGAMFEGVDFFKRAVDLDPEFALAWAGLAEAYVLLYSWREATDRDSLPAAERAARRALELDPLLGEANTAFGLVLQYLGEEPATYAVYLERGVELAPGSADARKWYGDYLSVSRHYEEALVQYQRAVELDPMSPIIRVNLAAVLEHLGRKDEAHQSVLKALEIDPTFRPAVFSMAPAGNLVDRMAFTSSDWSVVSNDAWIALQLVLDYLALGDVDRAEQWTRWMRNVASGSVPVDIAKLNIAICRDQESAIREHALKLFPRENPAIPVPSRMLMLLDLNSGNPQSARERYATKYPELLSDDPPVGENYPVAIDIAMLLQALGETQAARRLIERSLAYMERLDPTDIGDFGVHRARALAILGDHDAAISALQQAVAAGWRFQLYLYIDHDIALEPLRGDPRFLALKQLLSADMAGQLERVRELEASGKIVLPPDAVP